MGWYGGLSGRMNAQECQGGGRRMRGWNGRDMEDRSPKEGEIGRDRYR
jgi:hypothetical protein